MPGLQILSPLPEHWFNAAQTLGRRTQTALAPGANLMTTIGTFDMTLGQGGTYQEDEVTSNGYSAATITALDAAQLGAVDTLYVTNPSNSDYSASYTSALATIDSAVAGGMNLVMFDRYVTGAETILPGGASLMVVRDFSADTNVDLASTAPSWFTNGPAGTIDSTMFDGGNSSNHGYVTLASLPAGAVPLLTTGDPNHVVAFTYPYGDGMVFYSTIPLDYYSVAENAAITSAEVNTLFGNVIYGMGLTPPICFAKGTRIATQTGPRRVQDLRVGDYVLVRGGQFCQVRWIGVRRCGPDDLHHKPQLRPVKIRAGAMGNGLPLRDLRVSRQHRLMLSPPGAQGVCGGSDVLVAAIHLVGRAGIAVDQRCDAVEYFHILLDQHHLLYAEGCLAESLLLGPEARRSLPYRSLVEIAFLMPDRSAPPALPTPKGHALRRVLHSFAPDRPMHRA